MPPVRRKIVKGISNRSNRSQSTAANSDAESLRRHCTGRGLPNHWQENASISWLQQHATTSSSRPTVDATGNANLLSTSTWKPTIFVIYRGPLGVNKIWSIVPRTKPNVERRVSVCRRTNLYSVANIVSSMRVYLLLTWFLPCALASMV